MRSKAMEAVGRKSSPDLLLVELLIELLIELRNEMLIELLVELLVELLSRPDC